jgi:ankyrin repeat protein
VASENGRVEVVNILFKHGADYLLNSKYGTSPLQIAVLCNRTDVVHQLIRRENQHIKYKGNCHLFQILTDLRQFEMLVACDVSVQQRKQERLSDAIWNLILGGICDDLECLLQLGLDINQCNDKGRPLVCRLVNNSH